METLINVRNLDDDPNFIRLFLWLVVPELLDFTRLSHFIRLSLGHVVLEPLDFIWNSVALHSGFDGPADPCPALPCLALPLHNFLVTILLPQFSVTILLLQPYSHSYPVTISFSLMSYTQLSYLLGWRELWHSYHLLHASIREGEL